MLHHILSAKALLLSIITSLLLAATGGTLPWKEQWTGSSNVHVNKVRSKYLRRTAMCTTCVAFRTFHVLAIVSLLLGLTGFTTWAQDNSIYLPIVENSDQVNNSVSVSVQQDLPSFRWPWDKALNGQVKWTSGPHSWYRGGELTATITATRGSGLDFAIPEQVSFDVLAMASGVVIKDSCGFTGLGCIVAIRHDVGGSVMIYAHLKPNDAVTAPDNSIVENSRVEQGKIIGKSGRSGGQEAVHLHIDWRDGAPNCTANVGDNDCGDIGWSGNPVSWHGRKLVDGYYISGYCDLAKTQDDCNDYIYNYDGSASHRAISGAYSNFRFQDIGTSRTTLAWVHPSFVTSFQCHINDITCEIEPSDRTTVFAGHGQFGGGGGGYGSILFSSNTAITSPPTTPTPLPTGVPPASDGIEVVSLSSHTVSPGEGFNPSVTIKVTSGQLDTADYLHAIPEDNGNTFGAWPMQGVHNVVSTGNMYTFQVNTHNLFHMTAPQQTGTYQSVWRMHVNGQDVGPQIVIPITVRTVSDPHPIDYWDAYYYTSKDLSGSVSHHTTISDQYLFQDWGIGSPNAAIPVDNWSARLVREINFPGGDYHFHVQSDDGGRILIDGTTQLDAWWDSSFDGHDWTGTLTPGFHEVKVEYYDQGGDARLDVWWQGPGFLPRYPSCEPDQWCGDYWGNKTLSGAPPLTRNEGTGTLNVGWGTGSPGHSLPSDNFSARFTRTLPFACGIYRFHVTADDGERFYVDDVLKLDEWTYKGQYTTDVDVQISEGTHTLRVDYYEATGDTAMRLSWDQIMTCAPSLGELVVSSGQTVFAATTQTSINASGTTAAASSSEGFEVGDKLLFHQTQGTANAGKWEMAQIISKNGNSWTLDHALTNTYDSSNGRAQAVKVPHYTSVTVQPGATLTALPWNGFTGGILVFESDGNVIVDGTMDMTGKGFTGGGGSKRSLNHTGAQGETYTGLGASCSSNGCNVNTNNSGGGGSGGIFAIGSGGGAGAGYGSAGTQAASGGVSPGFTYGSAILDSIFFGSGGGGGYEDGSGATGGNGGHGGGIIFINAPNITVNGSVVADGAIGQGTASYSGGGGSGGSIYLTASSSLTIGTDRVVARGGNGGVNTSGQSGGNGGAGGVGRIHLQYCNTLTGSTNPSASMQQSCPSSTPTPTPTVGDGDQGIELLSQPWHLEGNNGADELYQEIPADVLQGKDMLRITYDLHGLTALPNDASAIVIDQGDWRFISLSNYGQNGLDGQQTVDIPLSDFPGLDPNQPVGTLHTRFWYGGHFTVAIYSIVVYNSQGNPPISTATPTMTQTPVTTPIPAATPTPGSGDQGVELLTSSWHLEGNDGADEAYQEIDPHVLQGKSMLRITYDLHGLSALGGDASAITFDQGDWRYISLSDYGQNGLNGVQTVDIPLADFPDLDPNGEVGTLHTRFWYSDHFVVDITSIIVY